MVEFSPPEYGEDLTQMNRFKFQIPSTKSQTGSSLEFDIWNLVFVISTPLIPCPRP